MKLLERELTLLENVYPQFQPKRALDVRAVVVAKRKTAVATGELSDVSRRKGKMLQNEKCRTA